MSNATAPLTSQLPEAGWAAHARFGAMLATNLAIPDFDLLV